MPMMYTESDEVEFTSDLISPIYVLLP